MNVFDQRVLEDKVIKNLKNNNIEILTRSTFLQGLLLIKKNKLPKKFHPWRKKFNNWYKELDNKKLNAYDVCLNLPLQNKNIDKVLIGINSFKQFKNIFNHKKKITFNYDKFKSNQSKNLINPSKWGLLK